MQSNYIYMEKKISLKSFVFSTRLFLLPYLAALAIIGILLAVFGKEAAFLWVNRNNSGLLDEFFKYYTYVGDGAFFLITAIVLLFIKIRYALFGVLALAVTGLSAQLFKRLIEEARPKAYFDAVQALHFVNGVNVHSYNSFPSGHTVTAFSMFLFLSAITKNKTLGFFYFLCAFLVGYSRIYLSQHFVADAYFGSILGVVLTIILYLLYENSAKLNSKPWMDAPIHKIKRTAWES